ncbi:hypothetical protein G9A89_006824 [Geosiphon pyriformis]|nr:hypothetical protein G9A89_006824 [Geosiphon pyriformis]
MDDSYDILDHPSDSDSNLIQSLSDSGTSEIGYSHTRPIFQANNDAPPSPTMTINSLTLSDLSSEIGSSEQASERSIGEEPEINGIVPPRRPQTAMGGLIQMLTLPSVESQLARQNTFGQMFLFVVREQIWRPFWFGFFWGSSRHLFRYIGSSISFGSMWRNWFGGVKRVLGIQPSNRYSKFPNKR